MSISELSQRLKGICDDQEVVRLDLFGSRARSEAAEGNDFDFVAEFTDVPPAEYSMRFFSLLHALEDELQHPVDLMSYRSIKKPSLRRAIERERIPLYER